MKRTVTLKEIADVAGVSTATVSYALNDNENVSEKTRLKIKAIAKEMNYLPNMSAKQLRTNDSKIVFAVLNTYGSKFNGSVLQEVENIFEDRGYQLLAVSGHMPEIIKTNIFDGGLLLNFNISDQEICELSQQINKPLILLSSDLKHPSVSSVTIDNQHGIKLVMAELLKSSHQKLCFFTGHDFSFNNKERLLSAKHYYEKWFKRSDFEVHTYKADFELNNAYAIAYELLSNKTYNAFVCFNDDMAFGVYRAAYELGLEVGVDLSVVGFNNGEMNDYMAPALTSVHIDKQQWAKQIVDQYFKVKEQPKSVIPGTTIATTLTVRGSIHYQKDATNIKDSL